MVKRNKSDGWTQITLTVTDEVADKLARLGSDRYRDMQPDTKKSIRNVCKAKDWDLSEVLAGLGVAELVRWHEAQQKS